MAAENGDIVWDGAAVAALLASEEGPVGRDLARRAILVEGAAKQNATGRPGPNVITGRLRDSITWTFGRDMVGLYADIGSNVEYAAYVEIGTVHAPPYPYLMPALPAGAATA